MIWADWHGILLELKKVRLGLRRKGDYVLQVGPEASDWGVGARGNTGKERGIWTEPGGVGELASGESATRLTAYIGKSVGLRPAP